VRRRGHAVLGGTFDHFHLGHAALLATAFRVGRSVSVGVTTDRYVAAHPKPYASRIQSYATRRRALRRWIDRHYPGRSYRLSPLEDGFGRSVEDGVEVLVISVDTLAGGRAVNAERRRLGRRPVPLVVVPVVLSDDLSPISSRRIRAGEIDRKGRRRAPISVGIGVGDPRDAPPTVRAVRSVFPTARVHVLVGGRPTRTERPTRSARVLARKALRGAPLSLGVARLPRGGWTVVERGEATEFEPRRVPRGTLPGLQRALRDLLRPGVGRKALDTPRSSRGGWRRTSA
jgi:pantetheine-phosphate adenylyltransferase